MLFAWLNYKQNGPENTIMYIHWRLKYELYVKKEQKKKQASASAWLSRMVQKVRVQRTLPMAAKAMDATVTVVANT